MELKHNIAAYLESWGIELQARKDRVRQLIGDAHWLTDGHHKEAILRDFLIRYLPNDCECSTGFVRSANGHEGCSPEVDILLFSRRLHLPYFCEGGVAIVDPASLLATVEVKSSFSKQPLDNALLNVKRTRSVAIGPNLLSNLWSGILFYEVAGNRTIESVLDTLSESIEASFSPTDDANYLPTCIILGQDFLVFPKVVQGKIQLRAFEGKDRALSCGISDLLSSLAPQLGGLSLTGFDEWGTVGSFRTVEKQIG